MAQTATLEELERQAKRLQLYIVPQDDGGGKVKYWIEHAWKAELFIAQGLREAEIFLNGYEAGQVDQAQIIEDHEIAHASGMIEDHKGTE